MKLVPLYNKIVVEVLPEDPEHRSESGLFLPGKNVPYHRGKVIGAGKGYYQNAQRIPMDIKEGDTVIFLKNSGMGIEFDNANIPTKLVLADNDIYAIEVE